MSQGQRMNNSFYHCSFGHGIFFLLYINVILFYIVLFNSVSLRYLVYVGIILGQRYYGCWICMQFIVPLTKYCFPFTPNIALVFPIEIEAINFNCSVHTFKYLFSKTYFCLLLHKTVHLRSMVLVKNLEKKDVGSRREKII